MNKKHSWNTENYNTAGYILSDPQLVSSRIPISPWANEKPVYLETPSMVELKEFYTENNLSPVNQDELHSIDAVKKLDDAMRLLNVVPNLVDCVAQLVRVIGVLKSASVEEDVSYSHPEVPFSIFVSVCNDRSSLSSARVAESILHEAMHLRLSLIQKTVELLDPRRHGELPYFSPWRHGERPANGVLHGIFVFRAILEFFRTLAFTYNGDRVVEYSNRRIKEISSELAQVRDFYRSPALNATGAELARHLVHI